MTPQLWDWNGDGRVGDGLHKAHAAVDRILEVILVRLGDKDDSFRDGLCFLENTLL